MIQDQHKYLLMADLADDEIEIAHMNTPCQRLYDFSKKFGDITGGEKRSRAQNLEWIERKFSSIKFHSI